MSDRSNLRPRTTRRVDGREKSAPTELVSSSGSVGSALPEPAKRRRRSMKAKDRAAFIERLENGWTVRAAAETSGHARQRMYEEREADEAFADAWRQAVEAGNEVIEQEMFRRAVEGYDETTYDGEGMVMRVVHRYSDTLLQRLAAARMPDRYGQNASATAHVEVSGPIVVESAFPPYGPIEHRAPTLGDVFAFAEEIGLGDALKSVRTLAPREYAELVDGEATEAQPALPETTGLEDA